MKIVDFKAEMEAKLLECNEWLDGKDKAIADLKDKEEAYNNAKVAVDEYTEANILAVTDYKTSLEKELGLEPVVEAEAEAVIELPIE